MKNKKILFVAEYFPPHIMGGAEISGEIKVNQLAKENNVVVLTPNYDNNRMLERKEDGHKVIRFPSFRYIFYKKKRGITKSTGKKSSLFYKLLPFFYIISALEFKYWIRIADKKYGPFDILCGNNIESDLGIAFSNINAKKNAYLRDAIIFDEFSKKNILIKIIKKKMEKIDSFIAISQFIKNKYKKILRISSSRFILDAMDKKVPDYMISSLTKISARKKLHLSKNKKYILFVGSITKNKGVDYLVEEIAPNFPDIDFLILGEGYLFEEMNNIKGSNVLMKGNIKKELIKDYYKAADLVLVTSVWEEPMGRVPLEAQANGTFVFVTDKGGLPETIKKGKGKSIELKYFIKEIKKYFEY